MSLNLSFLDRVARGEQQLAPSLLPARPAPHDPQRIIICLDHSGSMAEKCGRLHRLRAATTAVGALLDQRLAMGCDDLLALIGFDHRASLLLSFTFCRDHRRKIDATLCGLTPDGGTSLIEPLRLTEKILGKEPAHVILLSDGHGDNCTDIARRLKGRGVVIETIGVGNHPSEVDEPILKAAASVHNGKVLYRFITDANDLVTYFRTEIANRLVKRSP